MVSLQPPLLTQPPSAAEPGQAAEREDLALTVVDAEFSLRGMHSMWGARRRQAWLCLRVWDRIWRWLFRERWGLGELALLKLGIGGWLCASVAHASPSLFTFEDLPPDWTNSYGGLQWTNLMAQDGVHYTNNPSGYLNGLVSPTHAVFNAYAKPATLTRTNGVFNLLSGYLTGAWRDNVRFKVEGFYAGSRVYSNLWLIHASGPALIQFDCFGVDQVIFSSTGGVRHGHSFVGDGTHFVMDNLTVFLPQNEPSVVVLDPLPRTWLTNAPLLARGKAVSQREIASVYYQLNQADWAPASGAGDWQTPALALAPGTNWLSVYAVDVDGTRSWTNRMPVFSFQTAPLRVQQQGQGSILANLDGQILEVGKVYAMSAKPAAGFGPARWMSNLGPVSTNGGSVKFQMQSNLVLTALFPDIAKPVLTVTFPKSGQELHRSGLVATGTASDNAKAGSVQVWCRVNDAAWSPATGTTNWSWSGTMAPSVNRWQVCAVDDSGNWSSTNSLRVTYLPSAPLTVQTLGPGTVTPDYAGAELVLGRTYTLTATPAKGTTFVGWSGSWTTNKASLKFVMTTNLVFTATFLDTNRPVNVITFPTAGARLTNDVIQGTGRASDNVGATQVWYRFNGGSWCPATTSNHWTNWSTGPLTLQAGTNELQAVAQDAALNVSLTNTIRFIKSTTTPAKPGSTRWSRHTGGEILSSATLGPDGVVYFGNNAKRLYALNGATGAQIWATTLAGCVSTPALGPDGTLYVGVGGGRFYALEAATGREKWHYDTGYWIDSTPAVGSNRIVYCTCANKLLVALDAVNGTKRWSFNTTYEVYSSPAVDAEGMVYFGSGFFLYALDGNTGAKRWEFKADSYLWASPALACDGAVYFGSAGGTFFALDRASGQLRWSFNTGSRTDSSPALGRDGTLYVGSASGRLFALDAASGAKKWECRVGGDITSSPAVGADGTVYFGSWDGNLYAVDGATGRKTWQFKIGDLGQPSPNIAPDGTIYIGAFNAWFYAVNSDSPGLMPSAWPRFNGGPTSIGRGNPCQD